MEEDRVDLRAADKEGVVLLPADAGDDPGRIVSARAAVRSYRMCPENLALKFGARSVSPQ